VLEQEALAWQSSAATEHSSTSVHAVAPASRPYPELHEHPSTVVVPFGAAEFSRQGEHTRPLPKKSAWQAHVYPAPTLLVHVAFGAQGAKAAHSSLSEHTLGKVTEQVYPASTVHTALQPSLDAVLLSSHCSSPPSTPSPHTEGHGADTVPSPASPPGHSHVKEPNVSVQVAALSQLLLPAAHSSSFWHSPPAAVSLKPASQVQLPAATLRGGLVEFAGHAEHDDAPPTANEPALQGTAVAPPGHAYPAGQEMQSVPSP